MKENIIIQKTTEQAIKLLEDIGAGATVFMKIQVVKDQHATTEEKEILSDGVVYPRFGKPVHGGDAKRRAEQAVAEIKRTGNWFRVASNLFVYARGIYQIID